MVLGDVAEVTELWIYPVKGCQGAKVHSAKLTPMGLELDRAFEPHGRTLERMCHT